MNAADRRPLRGHQAEPIAQRIENVHAIALMLSESQTEDDHIVHLARVILEQLQAARTELDNLTLVPTQLTAPASAAGRTEGAQS